MNEFLEAVNSTYQGRVVVVSTSNNLQYVGKICPVADGALVMETGSGSW